MMGPGKVAALCCAFVLTVGPTLAGERLATQRPNVLFIAIDDLRPALGMYGDALAKTPHLDRLAARGTTFDRAFCQHALCAPSRASVITGLRPERFPQVSAGVQSAHYRDAVPDVVTLPQHFKNHGYHAESIGKVNHVYPPILDPVSWSVPERLADIVKRDEYLAPENRVGGFLDPMVKGGAVESVDAPDNAYIDGQAADAAIEALTRLKDRPFFLAVGTKRPHLPWAAPRRYWDLHRREDFVVASEEARPFADEWLRRYPWRYEFRPGAGELRGYLDIAPTSTVDPGKAAELRHGYYAAVSYVDAQIGRILDALDELDLARQTVVVVWSDHGFHLGENGQWGKKSNTELDLRVPLIVSFPGRTKPGARTAALVELVDLAPTLAELAGLPVRSEWEGSSFVPLLAQPDLAWKRAVYSQYIRGGVVGRAVRTAGHRYIEWRREPTSEVVDRELYDLEQDHLQRNNLAASHARLRDEHASLLQAGWLGSRPARRAH